MTMDSPVQLDLLDKPDLQAHKELLEVQVFLVSMDLRVTQEHLEQKVNQEIRDYLGCRETMEIVDKTDKLDQEDLKGLRDPLEEWEIKDNLVLMVNRDCKDLLDLVAPMDNQAMLGSRVKQEIQVFQVQ